MERTIINSNTGEVLSELNKGDRIVRRQSIEYLKMIADTELGSRHFIRIDASEGKKVLRELSGPEKIVLMSLQYYVSYESGLIRYSNGKEIGFSDIVEITGLSRRAASNALSRLVEMHLIYKGRSGRCVQYFMNPWIANKGIAVNKTLWEMFKDYQIRSKGNIRWRELKEHRYVADR